MGRRSPAFGHASEIPPGDNRLDLALEFFDTYPGIGTTKEDETALLTPAKPNNYSTAPLIRAKCLIVVNIVNATGKRETMPTEATCLQFARWLSAGVK